MSEDIGYTGDELEWACGAVGAGGGNRRANRVTWVSLIVGVLALGTALYAAFAPRSVLERAQSKIKEALSRTTEEAKEQAHHAAHELGSHVPG